MFCSQFPDLILTSQREQIRGLYAIPADEEGEQAHPGPFCFKDYLSWMLQKNTWGDQVVLTAIGMMWGLAISIVNVQHDVHLQLRHQRPLAKADIILVYNGVSHYNAAGKPIAR
jgi:hypothetical protein